MSIDEIIEKNGNKKENVIHILKEIQKNRDDNHVPDEIARLVAKKLDISESKIASILSFYTAISSKPRGKNVIQICSSLSCYINNSVNLVSVFENALGIKVGETTADKLFTLEYSSCLGACDISPAVRIGEKIYGNLTEDKILKIIEEYRGDINE